MSAFQDMYNAGEREGCSPSKDVTTLARLRTAPDRIREPDARMVKALPLWYVSQSALPSGRTWLHTTPWHALLRRFTASGSHPFVK